jgi:hypothetical protein
MASGPSAKMPYMLKPFEFLSLSTELRLCIYECLLKPANINIYSYDLSQERDEDADTGSDTIFYARWVGPKRPCWAILITCKAVYKEANTLLYRPSTLTLRPAFQYFPEHHEREDSVGTLSHRQRFFNISNLGWIQQLARLDLEIFTTEQTKDEDLAHSAALIKSFGTKVRIGTLSVKIFDRFFRCYNSDYHEVEHDTAFRLIEMWSKILDPKELRVLVGDKGDCVMVWYRKEDGSWTEQSLLEPPEVLTGKLKAAARVVRF